MVCETLSEEGRNKTMRGDRMVDESRVVHKDLHEKSNNLEQF